MLTEIFSRKYVIPKKQKQNQNFDLQGAEGY